MIPKTSLPDNLRTEAHRFGEKTAIDLGFRGFTPSQRKNHEVELKRRCLEWSRRQEGALPPQKPSRAATWILFGVVMWWPALTLGTSSTSLSGMLLVAGFIAVFIGISKAYNRLLGPKSAAVKKHQTSVALNEVATLATTHAESVSTRINNASNAKLSAYSKNRWLPLGHPPLTVPIPTATLEAKADLAISWLSFLGLPFDAITAVTLGPRSQVHYQVHEASSYLLYVHPLSNRLDISKFSRVNSTAKAENLPLIAFSDAGFTPNVVFAANREAAYLFRFHEDGLLEPASEAAEGACEYGVS